MNNINRNIHGTITLGIHNEPVKLTISLTLIHDWCAL